MAWYDFAGDIGGAIGGGLSAIGGAVSRGAGWLGETLGIPGIGDRPYVAPSLGQPVDLRARLEGTSRAASGSLLSRATDALGDIVEDVLVPIGGAALAQWAGGMVGGPRAGPAPGQTPGIVPGAIRIGDYTVYEPPALGSVGGVPGGLPSPTNVSVYPTVGARERSQASMAAIALPGGAAIGRALLPRALQALGLGAAGGAAVSLFNGGNGNGAGMAFVPTMAGYRANRHFTLPHPVTGEAVNFGTLGPCLLFSRDLSGAKKVDRLARRAKRARRGR